MNAQLDLETGGYYIKLGVTPDIVVYGKAISNGYPLTAVVGKKYNGKANDSFISSTFWTDRTGYVAGLATLKDEKSKSWKNFTAWKKIKLNWIKLAKKYELQIKISGIDALPNFTLQYSNWNKYKVYYSRNA